MLYQLQLSAVWLVTWSIDDLITIFIIFIVTVLRWCLCETTEVGFRLWGMVNVVSYASPLTTYSSIKWDLNGILLIRYHGIVPFYSVIAQDYNSDLINWFDDCSLIIYIVQFNYILCSLIIYIVWVLLFQVHTLKTWQIQTENKTILAV